MTKRAEIERLLRLGRPVEEIAKRVGTTPTYVRKVRVSIGMEPSSFDMSAYQRAYRNRLYHMLDPQERAKIRRAAYADARRAQMTPQEASTWSIDAVRRAAASLLRQRKAQAKAAAAAATSKEDAS